MEPGNKSCAILMAALVACAAGCALPVGYERGGNGPLPPGDHVPEEDGAWDEADRVCRICFRLDGSLCFDPEGRRRSGPTAAVAGDFSRLLNGECRRRGATLVVLIHGIDNTYPEARRSFELARMRVEQLYPGRLFVFLEVYWDGLCGHPLAVWGEARPGSKWVGLGLRPLLAGIDHSLPVRILCHSRGASVACAALWNVPFLEGPEFDRVYAERQRDIPAPAHPDVRLAMIAAAMGEEEFQSYGATPLDRVIVGINEDDPVLNKGFVGPGFAGSTRLGCRRAAFDEGVAPVLNRERRVAVAVDLCGSREHDFKDYLLRRAVKERLLPLLLEPAAASAAD